MPINVTLLGTDFQEVPKVILPKTGGGSAEFWHDLKPMLLRPDAELVKTFSYDRHIVADDGITIPEYSTTSATIKATEALSETYTLSYDNYNWYALQRALTIPEYSVTTKAKGRAEWAMTMAAYEYVEMPANTLHSLLDPTKGYTSRSVSSAATGAFSRLIYWSSGTAVAAYATAAYGTAQGLVAPTLASGVLTINTPNVVIRGHSTYFSSTYFNALTDIRYQWVFEIYRAPKNNLNFNGWVQATQAQHIINCVESNNCKLT